jgi:MFS family permease
VPTEQAPATRLSPDFWKFWAGQTISNFGTAFTFYVLPLLIFKLTGSPVKLGIQMAAELLPYLLFGLFIGAYADRLDRKRMMIATDIGRALVIALIPALAASHLLTVWWIYGAGFAGATLGIFFDAGEFAATPSLVPQRDLVTANGRIQASYSAAQIAGPILAGALVALIPVYDLLYVDAGSFILSAISLALVTRSFNEAPAEGREPSTVIADVKEGLRYVWSNPVLRNISFMMALVNFVAAPAYAELVLFAKERMHATDSQVAFLFAAGGAGIVLLSLAAGPLRKRWSFSKVALPALVLDGLALFILSFVTSVWIGLPIWALAMGAGILFNINTQSLRQAIVPNHMLGRVMSIASVLAWSAIPLGALLGGWAIAATNVRVVYAAIGVGVIALPVIFSFTALGHADDYLVPNDAPEPKPEPASA